VKSRINPERGEGYDEYINRIGDLVKGEVKSVKRADIIVDLNGIEAVLPRSEQSRHERWNQGDRIRTVVTNVVKRPNLPVELSRTSPNLLLRLFEAEVPEIQDGIVVIKAAVREPNERAKIAVISNDPNVDAVAACVGLKSSRVRMVTIELRGEKIDVFEWSDEPSVLAANALTPAKVNKIITDIEQRLMVAIVDEGQLSLAVGTRGQNVRLATKLVGWKIDLRTEE